MKHVFLTSALCLLTSVMLFSQMAGNSSYNQAADNYRQSVEQYAPKAGNVNYNYQTQTKGVSSATASAWISRDSVFELSVNAMMNVKASSYVVSLGVSQAAETIDSCQRMINERISSFIAQLTKSAVKREDIFVDFVSQVPVFEYTVEKKMFSKKYNEIPSGFELKKNIHISFKKSETLDEIVTTAAKSEIYDIIKVDYVVANIKAVYDSLRDASIKLLNEKVEDYKRIGIKFNPKFQVMAEDVQSIYPIERYKTYTAYNNSSLQALRKGGVSTTNISYQPKQATLYYDKLPYNNYDIVINPSVIEPVAQFTYNLKVRYTYKDEEAARERAAAAPPVVKKP